MKTFTEIAEKIYNENKNKPNPPGFLKTLKELLILEGILNPDD